MHQTPGLDLKFTTPRSFSPLHPSAKRKVYKYGKAAIVHLYAVYTRGYAKIGVTGDIKTRIGTMQGGCPFPIELLASFPLDRNDAPQAEQMAGEKLDPFHWHGEWFKCSRQVALYTISQAAAAFPVAVANGGA